MSYELLEQSTHYSLSILPNSLLPDAVLPDLVGDLRSYLKNNVSCLSKKEMSAQATMTFLNSESRILKSEFSRQARFD